MNNLTKIILAVLFMLSLFDMPYGFYQIVRLAGLIGFIFLAFQANQNRQPQLVILYICLAILFQPLIKISLGRTIWNIIDIVVAVFLVISLFSNKKSSHLF